MTINQEFYTMRGYRRLEESKISVAMEDYLEMIYRMTQEDKYVRVNQLAALLNVKPSSSSKMIHRLKENELVDFEPYGIVKLTKQGMELGEYLLHRHDILSHFFCLINQSDEELELVEKIEHFIDKRTVENIEKWLQLKNI